VSTHSAQKIVRPTIRNKEISDFRYITAADKKLIILRCFIKKSNKLPLNELKISLKRAGEIKNG